MTVMPSASAAVVAPAGGPAYGTVWTYPNRMHPLLAENVQGIVSSMTLLKLDSLLAVERAGWDSLCEGSGGSFYGELMIPAGQMIISNGMVLDRAAVKASLDNAPTWDRYEISEARQVPLGAESAALIYAAQSVRGDEAPFVATMTSVYCLVDGRLRLALYQQTVISN